MLLPLNGTNFTRTCQAEIMIRLKYFIETCDGGLAVAGALDETECVANYYLAQTMPFLPAPTPTPPPTTLTQAPIEVATLPETNLLILIEVAISLSYQWSALLLVTVREKQCLRAKKSLIMKKNSSTASVLPLRG